MEHPDEKEATAMADNPFESTFDDNYVVHTPRPSQYELSPADGARESAEARPSSYCSTSTPRRPISLNAQADSKSTPPQLPRPPVRSSIAKNPIPSDSSREPLPNRQVRVAVHSHSRQPIELLRRSSSRASSYAPFEASTTQGSNGPSHPYGMYPQTSVLRSSSVTTTSTLRHSSSTSTPGTRPAHPYALYQQNGLQVPDDDSTTPQVPAIQVGFPGHNANFHRQMGPDGEEQDIIGPDGHTEQLPPYSQYPNVDERAMATLESPTPSHESEQVLVPSAQPPPQRSQDHTESAASEMADSGITVHKSEKSWKEMNWKERWKAKVPFRLLPRWVVVIALGCLLFIGVVIGGAIGVFLAKERQNRASSGAMTQSTLDASTIPVPTNVPAFPVGQFLLPIGSPDETEQSCLTDASQTKAWSCNIPTTKVIISTGTQSGGFSLAKIYPDVQTYQYGAQPPTVVPAEKLSYVIDLSDPQRGPALHFQTVYDKLVILDPSSLSLRKRQGRALPNSPTPASINGSPVPLPSNKGSTYRRSTVQSGEQPWFCFWNSTSIEGFIYITQPSNNYSSTNTTTTTTTYTSSTTSGIMESTLSSGQPAASPSASISSATSTTPMTSINPDTLTSTLLTSTLLTSTLLTSTTTSVNEIDITTATSSSATPTTTITHGNGKTITKKDNDSDDHPSNSKTTDSNNLPEFPYIIKLTERRLPNPPSHAYCQKMNVNDDGSVTPVLENNNPIIINLQETDPSESQFASAATSPVSTSAATSTPTNTATLGTNKGYIAERDVEEVEEELEAEEDWNLMERSIEERVAEAAVEEWERSFGPAAQPWYLGKREDPAQSCACQWLVV